MLPLGTRVPGAEATTTAAERRPGLGGVLARVLLVVTVSVIAGALTAGMALPFAGLAAYSSESAVRLVQRLPEQMKVEPLAQRTVVLDRGGRRIATFYRENRVVVSLSDVAPVMVKALVAIEDHRFFEHNGLDTQGTLRALVRNRMSGEVRQGGSSLTQQLVKMIRLDQADTDLEEAQATEQSYHRKLQELRFALALEREHSKRWILQRYLNQAYFGDGAYGVEAAARHYFARSADELTLRQAALLAGLVKNPSGDNPVDSPRTAKKRRDVVLMRMAQLGMVSPRKAEAASSRPLGLRVRETPNGCVSSRAPLFCSYVRSYLLTDSALGRDREQREEYLEEGGLTIRTTFDRRFQRAAARAVTEHVRPTDPAIGALAMVEPRTGKVRALAQSRPLGAKKRRGGTWLNYTVPSRYGSSNGFQAGSTFKTFVLAAAVEKGVPLDTRIKAPPRLRVATNRYRGCDGRLKSDRMWTPANSTGSGTFDLYSGTRQSVNTFFAKLELRTGLCRPYRIAKRLGVRLTDPDNQQVPSFALGVADTDPLTMAAAYATFAARGVHCDPRPVRSVVTASGARLQGYGRSCSRVLRKPVADAVNDVLRGVQEPGGFGHSAGLSLKQPSAGKTGTTNSSKAVWFVGYTPNMAAASMIAGVAKSGARRSLDGRVIGGRRVESAAGSTLAGPVWARAMKRVQRILPDQDFRRPDLRTVTGVPLTVPDVVGRTQPKALRSLLRRGLGVRIEEAPAAQAEPGTVVRTRPSAGSRVRSGDRVTVTVAG